MIFENGKFTHARYVSSKKDTIEAIWYDEEHKQYHQVAIATNLENPAYVKVLETFTTDEISTMTDQHSKEQAENFKLFVKEMATEYGLVYDPNAANRETIASYEQIFNPPEGDEGTDLLFNIKLKIFDLPQVVDSDNAELKRELREAETPLKALYVAGKFLFE
jgi:hypothetical protein